MEDLEVTIDSIPQLVLRPVPANGQMDLKNLPKDESLDDDRSVPA